MTGEFRNVFEIGIRSFPWVRLLQPMVFVAIGALLVRFLKNRMAYVIVGACTAAMASIFFLLLLVTFTTNFLRLHAAYVSGKSTVVDGLVENFRPAPTIGASRESFTVGGVLFSYNALEDTPCFHNSPLHKGPIRAGLEVRIFYNDGCIQRVDVREQPSPQPQ